MVGSAVDHECHDPQDRGFDELLLGVARDFETQSPEMTALVHREISTAFVEDKHMLEAQQMSIERYAEPSDVKCRRSGCAVCRGP